MNGRHRTIAIAIAILGLTGGLAASVVPASAATGSVPAATVCTWTVNTNGTDFFANPGQGVITTLNAGAVIENPSVQTATNGSSTYEHGSHNGTPGWVREARLDFDGCA
jgi:hypothetical protein